MNCPPDYICIAYPGWYAIAFIILVIAGVALAAFLVSRR